VKKQEVLQEALGILRDEETHLSGDGHRRFLELLTKEVEEDSTPDPEPMTDARWHEYALAAVGAFGNLAASVAGGEHGDQVATATATVNFSVRVADGILAAAKERAK
jgi:hypothetical protein